MYNVQTITEALRGLVGFEDSYGANLELTDDLKESESGLVVGETFHPLLTADNIVAIAQRFYPGVTDEGDRETAFNDYLAKRYDASVKKLVARVFTEKKLNEKAKTLLTGVTLFEGVGNITGRITKEDRLVGYKISLKHPDTIAHLSHIGLQLDAAQNPVTIYLYHTSGPDPVKTFTLNHTKSIQSQWHKVTDATLAQLNDDHSGGHYYLCYYEEDLDGSAIKKELSFSGKRACGTCSEAAINSNLYAKWNAHLAIQPFYVNGINLPGDKTLWEEDYEIFVDNTTWGLNLQLTVQCDVTNVLLKNRSALASALEQQLKVDLLQEMVFSLRDNQLRHKISALAAAALDNPGSNQFGEIHELSKAIKALSFDLSGMSDLCLGCAASKFKMKSVWNV